MDKRTFLRKSVFLGIGGTLAGNVTGTLKAAGLAQGGMQATRGIQAEAGTADDEPFKLPELGYAYDALEPYIDARTMEIHHDRHHAGYTRNFNAAVLEAGLAGTKIREIFSRVSRYPAAVRNNGGGYFNHKMYWKSMSPKGGGEPAGDLKTAIDKSFGSFGSFREKLSEAAATRFGSGWAWLVSTEGGLVVTSTPNQDNPMMDIAEVGGFPLLAIDVWEHAYYLKHQNRRSEYIEAFWHVVDWDYVQRRYARAMK
jgi:Fe-Mn family superoxide dismutase